MMERTSTLSMIMLLLEHAQLDQRAHESHGLIEKNPLGAEPFANLRRLQDH